MPEKECGIWKFYMRIPISLCASSPLAWIIFHLSYSLKWIGVTVLVLFTMFLMFLNRRAIIRYQKAAEAETENIENKTK